MKPLIRIISSRILEKEFQEINVTSSGQRIMLPKGHHFLIKIKNIDWRAGNILKQQLLSLGGDVALDKRVLTGEVKKTSVILLGDLRHYYALREKILSQPFGLKNIASVLLKAIKNYTTSSEWQFNCRGKKLLLGTRTLIMGIVNVTPDSFSDGGKFLKKEDAVKHGLKLAQEGADIIDVGGESTRPGARKVSPEEELRRVLPVVEALSRRVSRAIISIDTSKARVAQKALERGAGIVNDITGLQGDREMAEVVAQANCPVIIMHIKGTPRTMQRQPSYQNLIEEILQYFERRIDYAIKKGIKEENIIIDPGIGFGKTTEHNLEIIKHLDEFRVLGRPILIGTSRKSFIGNVLCLPVEERLEGTAATVAISILKGARIVRVHDVKEMARVVKMADALKEF
jgi:dihydropteroate synthase